MDRKRLLLLWSLSLLVTLVSASWQRRSGPSYPARGTATLGSESIDYRLARSHVTGSSQPVEIRAADPGVVGELVWRRYPTRDEWTVTPMRRDGDRLVASLPSQPAAGKLEYRVRLTRGSEQREIPPAPAVTRFRGDVPLFVLAPHILAMFTGMLFSSLSGFAAVFGVAGARRYGRAALGLMSIGGLALGPLVQKYAFDAWWTGFPFGTDLTDNKTAIAVIAWIAALWWSRREGGSRRALVAAALVTLAVFAIPHSLFGSEIRWDASPTPGG